ncbi:ATP-dependent bile acid permease, partial [Lachnellula occidentalis]
MAQFIVQDYSAPRFQGFAAHPSTSLEVEDGGVSGGRGGGCRRVWDPVNARFEPCALPFISAIPAAITLCILLSFVLQLLPTRKVTPKWLQVFIHEIPEQQEELLPKKKRHFTFLSGTLLAASLVGFILQTVSVFRPKLRLETIYPAASWAIACLVLLLQRPAKTPKALLVLYTSIFATQAIVLIDSFFSTSREDIPSILALITSPIAILTIIHMPLRDPSLPRATISPAFGPPTDKLRSPEDDLTLWQFMSVSWMKPLIDLGNARQLNDEDVWALSYEFQHRILHDRFRELKGSVLRRLIEANGVDLVIISVLSILELCANFSAPVLLQKILQSMEDHRAPKRAALTYALFSLVLRLVGSQSAVFSLWYGRRAYERSRGEMITMLYEKTLSRKVVSVSSKPEENGNGTNGTNGSVKSGSRSRWRKVVDYLKKPFQSKKKTPVLESAPEKSPELASMGKIMNLMRFDAYEVSQRFWEFSSLVSQPLGLVFSVVLIWRLIGWPCLIGVVTVFIAQAINAFIARALLSWEKDRRIATDNKLHKIGQLVEAIRHLRYYGWQDVWLARIMEARQHELTLRIITALWRILIAFTNSFASGMFPVVAFYAYTVWAGQPLTVDVAFPALQLFSMMETSLREVPNLITVLLNAKISVARLEEFMSEPEKEDADTEQGFNTKLEMKNASFAWPGATEPVLSNITLSFPVGLTVIYGEVGAGKTALLQALLGELDRLSGEYDRANDPVGYCAQTPWLQSMSIRENILFSSPYEEARYKQVLDACALIPDMANFKHGDLSLVGENGVGLSGGQKARLSLARAVYSRANILLLDDPLSALDHHTAESIVRKCLSGPLLKDRTAILVTHRTELCLGLADQIVHVVDGQARVIEAESIASEDLHGATPEEPATEEESADDIQQLAAVPEKFMDDEHRAHGGVKASIYWEYIKAGKLRWWFVLIVVLALYRVIDVGETWFLKQWGEAYGERDERASSGPFGNLPNPETNIRPWLIGFFLIAAAQSITYLISQAFMLVIIYQAGKNMFERVMTRVTHATFRFYDVTPVGRLMNRLTSDINTIDGNISNQFQNVAMLSISWISSIVVIGSVTPLFLIFAIALTIAFVVIFMHFLPTSQSLRRLEMVSLSPLISNFGELATGLTSIRAFKVSHLFQARVITVTDNFQKMDHFYWSLQAWLMYRFDNLSAISTFLMTTMALYTGVSPGLTAFLLTAAGKFVLGTHLLCKQYGQLQMDFVSVERVVELLHLPQEPPGRIDP